MRCPNCHHQMHTDHLGVAVCPHCWQIGKMATQLVQSKPVGLQRLLDPLRHSFEKLRIYIDCHRQAFGIMLAAPIGLFVLGSIWTAPPHNKTAPIIAVKPVVTPPSGSVNRPKATTTHPSELSTPATAPTAPKYTPSPAPTYSAMNNLCQIDASQAPEFFTRAKEMVSVCQTVYPQIEAMLTPSSCPVPHKIVIDYNQYAAYAQSCVVHVSIDWLRNSSYDPGLIPHELTHTIQGYGSNAPGWITEGIATYMSYRLGYSIGIAHCNSDENYLSGYGCGASLFNYIERVYKPSIVKETHNAIKANTYTDGLFATETGGKSLATLYGECQLHECAGGK